MRTLSLGKRLLLGYMPGVIILVFVMPYCVNDVFWGIGQFIAFVGLGLIYLTSRASGGLVERFAVAGTVSLMVGLWLFMIVSGEVANRGEYQSLMVFGGCLFAAIFTSIWPIRRISAGWRRQVARSMVFTLCLYPIPYGSEGTLVPLIGTLFFPPLIFLFLFASQILLCFLLFLSALSLLADVYRVTGGYYFRLSGTSSDRQNHSSRT